MTLIIFQEDLQKPLACRRKNTVQLRKINSIANSNKQLTNSIQRTFITDRMQQHFRNKLFAAVLHSIRN